MLLCKLGFKESIVRWQERTLLLVLAGLWLLLFWNNARLLPFHRGFDWKEHLGRHHLHPATLVAAVTDRRLGNVSAATLLFDCGSKPFRMQALGRRPDVDLRLRCLGAFFGIANFVLVFLTLRLLLPVRAALLGLLFAAFLPMHLYIAHYVTNELLSAA